MTDNGISTQRDSHESIEFRLLFRRLADRIKTPLHGLQGMFELMKKLAQNDEMTEYLHIAEAYNLEVITIISDCLDYIQLRSGEFQLNPDWINLEAAIGEINEIMNLKASAKGIDFICHLSDNARGWIYTDPDRIRQLLVNLIDNALKATRKGNIELRVESLGTLEDQVIMAFKVKDTGQGIDPAIADAMLLALAQEDTTALLKIPGMGAGMLIIKELSRLMHGEISFETHPNEGTTFWFTASFPYQKDLVSSQKTTLLPGSLKILLVEDNFLNQKFTKTALIKAGHEVDLADNGKMAVEKYQSAEYDIVLMDVQLPIMDGIEATRRIREIEKTTGRHTPIIAITAYALDRDRIKCLEAGMDLFLAKPFKPVQLMAMIEQALEIRKNV
ncbi:MAG: response regulator [Bacteroidales bacterium]